MLILLYWSRQVCCSNNKIRRKYEPVHFIALRDVPRVPADRLPSLLRRIGAYTRVYEKEQPVYRIGDTAHALCVLLSGSVTIERGDAWGRRTILDHIAPGAVFAETYACVPGTPMMVSAVASEPPSVPKQPKVYESFGTTTGNNRLPDIDR